MRTILAISGAMPATFSTSSIPCGCASGKQIIAVRFAGDDEFVALAQKAADLNLAPDAIKRAVKHWRPDTYRA